ncbi:hypothetical protein LTSESEN_1513, partial [Salmonella enterica subsp. enterica serovar Senftenberg str. A4-543]
MLRTKRRRKMQPGKKGYVRHDLSVFFICHL